MEAALGEGNEFLAELVFSEDCNIDRERIEEFVGEDNTAEAFAECVRNGQLALRFIDVDWDVGPFGKVRGHFAAAGAELDYGEIRRLAQGAVELADARGDEDAEDGLQLFGSEEVALRAEGVAGVAV